MEAPMQPAATANETPAKRYARLGAWVLESFGPLIAYFVCYKLWGIRVATVCGIATGVLLLAREIYRTKKVSPFTAYSASAVAVFGYLEWKYQSGFFMKLEPALGNTATGLFFLTTVFLGRPIIIEFAERQAGMPLPHARKYLAGWTVAWSCFFFVRAAVFVWTAYHLSLDTALIVRGTVMPLSFLGMFLIEPIVRRIVFGKGHGNANPIEPALTTNNAPGAGDPPPGA